MSQIGLEYVPSYTGREKARNIFRIGKSVPAIDSGQSGRPTGN